MPLEATNSDAFNSPVDGLYSSLALLVNTVVGVPLVAEANMGNRSVAVVVSLLKDAPDTTAAQVASPRQNVLADAEVPEFRLVTGRLPVTSAVKDTAPKVGAPLALPCRTVVVVPKLAIGVGVAPAPAPNTNALAVNATDDANVPVAV